MHTVDTRRRPLLIVATVERCFAGRNQADHSYREWPRAVANGAQHFSYEETLRKTNFWGSSLQLQYNGPQNPILIIKAPVL